MGEVKWGKREASRTDVSVESKEHTAGSDVLSVGPRLS